MENEKKLNIAEKLICISFAAVALYLALRYAAAVFLPFILAWLPALAIHPLSVKTNKKTHIPVKVCAAVYVTLFIALIAFLVFLAVNRFVEEAGELLERLTSDGEMLKSTVAGIIQGFDGLSGKIPFIDRLENIEGLENIRARIDGILYGIFDDTVAAVSARVPVWIGNIIKGTPGFLIAFIVTVMACYYISMDYERISRGIVSLIPERHRENVMKFKNKAATALGRYARAYLLIMLITFTEIFIGLMILGRKYAFIMAIIIAVVDILPVLGAGTVLIPWAVIMLLTGNYHFGFGLLILYGVVTIVRQVIEPRIVGGSIGLHPLVTLVAMFCGLRLFGVFGMIAGPAVALLIKEFITTE